MLRKAEAMSETAISQGMNLTHEKMSLRVVARGAEAYLPSLEITCSNPFAQKRPLSSLLGRGPMTYHDSIIERRSS